MFDLIYLKLKRFHDKLCYNYSCLVNKYSIFLIAAYLLLNILLIIFLSLFKINVNLNTQEFTFTKNSEYSVLKREINDLFEHDQRERHYIQQLTDSGYYIDIIVSSKSKENFINKTILDDFNKLFFEINNLSIEYNNRSFSYKDDLCARRLNKCSIEGGIFNAKQFQTKLLNKQIGYDEFDGRELYMDADVNDGTSLNFLFGTERDEVYNWKKEENKHYGREKLIVGVKYVRNRFDLIYDTPEMTKLSLLWLNRFVDFMKENSTKLFNYIDIAYSTSHHLEKEIEYYSRIDAKYFMISISFLIVFFFGYIWFDFQTNRNYFLKCFIVFLSRFI